MVFAMGRREDRSRIIRQSGLVPGHMRMAGTTGIVPVTGRVFVTEGQVKAHSNLGAPFDRKCCNFAGVDGKLGRYGPRTLSRRSIQMAPIRTGSHPACGRVVPAFFTILPRRRGTLGRTGDFG
jgi:hypothetical protein